MNRAGKFLRLSAMAGALLLLAPAVLLPWPASSVALSQEDRAVSSSPAGTRAGSSQESPSVPHGSFLLDYLLVALFVGGAIYAVCRPSRRV
jgi:hypothetical protein